MNFIEAVLFIEFWKIDRKPDINVDPTNVYADEA